MTENNTTLRSNAPMNENKLEQEDNSKDLEIIQNLKNITLTQKT